MGRTEVKRGTMAEEGEMYEARLKMDEKNREKIGQGCRGCGRGAAEDVDGMRDQVYVCMYVCVW
jgi:hypothetical protein